MTRDELQKGFKEVTGTNSHFSDKTPKISYTLFLEDRLIRASIGNSKIEEETKNKLLEILYRIKEPEAPYNRDMEIYLDRLVKTCISLAEECIEIIEK